MEAYEFDPAVQDKLDKHEKKVEAVQADIIKYSIEKQQPLFDERDEIINSVEKFWPKTLMNSQGLAVFIDDEDREALNSLKAIRVDRDSKDPRSVTIHFDFNDNEYFSDKTLSKKFVPAKDAEPLGSDDYDFAETSETTKTTIHWKSDEKNLSKKNPSKINIENGNEADDEASILAPGSFFSTFFEATTEPVAHIGDRLINDLYPRALEYYTGDAIDIDDMFDDDDEFDEEFDEEDDDDDDKEIDLEEEDDQPPAKKNKK
ncbi:uncharacterized protein FA14DRAFT_161526 [Meira miltonrushii]|uniref:Uncharacterized protein n=1 Tax=Meira miltonrushii TaxID=1280837 RepID=A0A316V8D6_9BASI|nr:uncharacterized protein FA14DRAFT_161526 [Meira miltonrushii]PWN33897.1 hypothetical protein FA14DRAFT_161526 [Meira miltonrushii]